MPLLLSLLLMLLLLTSLQLLLSLVLSGAEETIGRRRRRAGKGRWLLRRSSKALVVEACEGTVGIEAIEAFL